MKIYGLSDARTHRIIPFPRSPFLEYQWGGARLRPGSSVSDLLFSIPASFLKVDSPLSEMKVIVQISFFFFHTKRTNLE